jgi:two-component system cell cycle sensor histidine kinase/response regulator CckA
MVPAEGAAHAEEAVDAALRVRGAQLSLLVEVNAMLAAAIDAEDVLGQILARLAERARLANASIHLLEEGSKQLRCIAHTGLADVAAILTLPLDGPGVVSWVARAGESVYLPEVARDPRYVARDPRTRSQYAVPLRAGAALVGVLAIESAEADGIRAVTRKLIDQFAGQVALAIERSELYKKLRTSERRLRSIFEQSHLGAALCDLEMRFTTVNPALAALLHRSPDELPGTSLLDVTHPEDRAGCREQLRQLLESRTERVTFEGRLTRPPGETFWCTTIASLIRDAAGKAVNLLVIVQDISERKQAEAERARLQEQLFQSQKMKALGTLAGGIAHDFNNLLGVISGYVSLIRLRLPREDPLQQVAATMQLSAERAADLTRQLLQFSRSETPRLQPLRISEPIESVLKIVSQTFDRRIRVEANLSPDLPMVEGDAGQLELALLNLAINARDAMPEGGTLTFGASVVHLSAGELPPDAPAPPGAYVRIIVRDTGRGIEPEAMHRIFEPFFTTKEAGKGSGLGLAMVYGTVMNHKGFIGVRSQAGRGSEFLVHLPVAGPRVEAEPTEIPRPAEHGRGTILVVDDEPLMRDFACDAVEELGYTALAASDGAEAQAICAEQASRIQAILLDMVMPGPGWEATLRALLAADPASRIIMTSGYNGEREARRVLEEGAVAFIGKPYTIDQLARVLKEALSRERRM